MKTDRRSIVDELTLLTVMETGSFSAAAHRLGITQSSVSRRISMLEERLGGIRLLARTTRVVKPTELGINYAARIRNALDVLREADQALAGAHDSVSGKLRLLLPQGMAHSVFDAPLSELASRHENLRYEIVLASGQTDLYRDQIDLAIRTPGMTLNETKTEVIGHNWWVFIAAPEYLDAHGRSNQISDHVFVPAAYRHRGPYFPSAETVERQIANQPFRFRIDDGTLKKQMVCAGHGVTLLPWLMVAHEVRSGHLELLPMDTPQRERPLAVTYRAALAGTAKLEVTVEAMRDTVAAAGEPHA